MQGYVDIRIRPYHVDLFQHVNNARYLEFLEEARWSLWESTPGFRVMAARGWVFMVVNIDISYRVGARAFQEVTIETGLAGLGERSGRLHQEIRLKDDGTLLTEADVVFVIVDTATNTALPMSEVGPLLLGVEAGGDG